MDFTFDKQVGGDIDVYTVNRYGEKCAILCVVENDKIEVVDHDALDPHLTAEQKKILENSINNAYFSKVISKKRKRSSLRIVDSSNHWWLVLPEHKKLELVSGLADRLIGFVDALLEKNPNDIKRDHYDSLIRRSQIVELQVSGVIDPRKLRKLPRYDAASGRLHGTIRSFIALAEVCYPSSRYKDVGVIL